jgi:hypothetical protein
VTGFCEHGDEPTSYIKGREYLGWLCSRYLYVEQAEYKKSLFRDVTSVVRQNGKVQAVQHNQTLIHILLCTMSLLILMLYVSAYKAVNINKHYQTTDRFESGPPRWEARD